MKGIKIPEETIELMRRLYDNGKGLSVAEVARKVNLPYPTTWAYTAAKRRGFESPKEYNNHLAGGMGFASRHEYQEHLTQQEVSSPHGRRKRPDGRKSFMSYRDYREHMAKEKGFGCRYEYEEYLARKNGFVSYGEYQKYLRLRRKYGKKLSGMTAHLKLAGYVKTLGHEGDGLVVKLPKKDFDSEFIETIFRDNLRECSRSVPAICGFEVSCEWDIVFIKPDNIESNAFLGVYRRILERDVVR